MTRMHFEAIAGAIRGLDVTLKTRGHIATSIARVLPQFNSGFDRARFLRVCIGESVETHKDKEHVR